MRQILFLVIVHELLTRIYSINGVIWDKNLKDFVPIVSIPTFAAMNQEILNRSRAEEIHNFQGSTFKISYYEIKNIIHSKNNGTAITGVVGEIWNTLGEILNFTLKPHHWKVNSTGFSLDEDSINLLHLIHKNGTDIISNMASTPRRRKAAMFTQPLYKTKMYFYTRLNVKHVQTWMLNLFSKRVWFSILATYVLFSFFSYLTQTIDLEVRKKSIGTINDYFFYNFGMLCSQTTYPKNMSESSRIVEYLMGMFTLLINAIFSAVIIGYLTQVDTSPLFNDFRALFSSYNFYAINGSIVDLVVKMSLAHNLVTLGPKATYNAVPSIQDVYKILCTSKDLTVAILSSEVKKASGKYICRLNPAGSVPQRFDIVSGISNHVKYKRSIDIGLMKLFESGIGSLLWYRWVDSQDEQDELNAYQSVVMEQVYLILYIFFCGLMLSLIFLLFENLIFYCKKKRVT